MNELSRKFVLLHVTLTAALGCGAWATEITAPAGDVPTGVSFETRELRAELEPSESGIDLVYRFRNHADIPAFVERFDESCGCMAGTWDGVAVEPGEEGQVVARFAPNGLRGKIRKSLRVNFVGGESAELIGEVTVHPAVEISHAKLTWPVGGEPSEQILEIKMRPTHPVKVTRLSGVDGVLDVNLAEVAEGLHYRISVRPLDTSKEAVHVLQVRTDSKDPRDAAHAVFVLIEQSNNEEVPGDA